MLFKLLLLNKGNPLRIICNGYTRYLFPHRALRYIGFMTIAVIVVLATTSPCMYGVPSSIIVGTARIVSSSVPCRTCEWVTIALGREIVPVRGVRHRANMTLNISSIATGVATYRCGVVVDSTGNAVRYTWDAIAY